MLASFVYVGREALEMAFLTVMVSTAIGLNWKVYVPAFLGLITGIVSGWFLGEALEAYEVGMYALLSALMFYLFFNSKNMAKHLQQHVNYIRSGQTGLFVGMFTIFFIFAREFMEICIFMFQSVNNTSDGWLGAGLAIALVFGGFPYLKKHIKTQTLFSITRYTFLIFALWFGYEAIEHLG